jgi:hypothetical protein
MIIELIGFIIAASVGLGIITIIILTLAEVLSWFTTRNDLYYSDEDHIAFTLQQKLQTGQYETVQGIFNKRTTKMAEARKVKSDQYDEGLAARHKKAELVVYE